MNVTKSAPDTYAVSLAEAKTWLAIDHTSYDDMIEDVLIPAAQDMIERYTGVCLSPTTVVEQWNGREQDRELVFTPYADDLEVTIGDVDSTDSYTVLGDSLIGPATTGSTVISYTAGFSTPPAGLKAAMLALLAYKFQYRETSDIPDSIRLMLMPYMWRTAF